MQGIGISGSSRLEPYFQQVSIVRKIPNNRCEINVVQFENPRPGYPPLLIRKEWTDGGGWTELEVYNTLGPVPYVPKVYFAWSDGAGYLSLFLEYAAKNNLETYLQSLSEREKPVFIHKLITSLLRAVGEMHLKRILHRDIKPSNIFITVNTDIKIGDFGSAINLEKSTDICSNRNTTAGYYCLQVGKNLTTMTRTQAEQALMKRDIWSLGKTLLEAMCGTIDLDLVNQTEGELMRSIDSKLTGQYERYRVLIKKMMSHDISRIPNTQELLATLEYSIEPPSRPRTCLPYDKTTAYRLVREALSVSAGTVTMSNCSTDRRPATSVTAVGTQLNAEISAFLRCSEPRTHQVVLHTLLKQLCDMRKRREFTSFRVSASNRLV